MTAPDTSDPRLPPAATAGNAAPQRLDSRRILGADGRVEIEHRGEVYRLSETRQGKLILTK